MPRVRQNKTVTKRRRGEPQSAMLRWNLQQASREFGQHREVLERRRRALSIEPGEDGCFSSTQISAMIFGDKEAETIGKIAAERRNLELKNELMVGELIPTAVAAKVAESFLVPVRQKILSSSLSESERIELLDDLVRLGDVDWQSESTKAAKAKA